MPTLDEIQLQIKALGPSVDTFGTKKEIRHLPEIMNEGEHVLYLTSGLMENSTWLIVCTEQRVLLLDKGLMYGLKMKEISIKNISSIEQSTGLFFGQIAITVSSSKMKIENVMKHTVKAFVDVLNRARASLEEPSAPTPALAASAAAVMDDVVNRLERLASLRDRGVLTETEFADQKSKILASV